MRHTLVAVFDNRSDAQNALDELRASGFSSTDTTLSTADPTGETNSVTGTSEQFSGEHEEGFGASIKHFFTSLFGSDTSEHAMKYSHAVTRGHHVVTLTTESEPEVERAADIIERFGPVDIDERHDQWSKEAGMAGSGVLGAGVAAGGLQQSQSMSAQSGAAGSGSTAAGSASYGSSTGSYGSDSLNAGMRQGTEPGALQRGTEAAPGLFGTQNLNDEIPEGTTYEEPLSTSRQSDLQTGSLNQGGSTLQGTASIPGSDDTSLGGTAMQMNSGSLQRDSGLSGSQQRDVGTSGNMRVYSRDHDTMGAFATGVSTAATGATASSLGSTADDDWYRSDWNTNYSSLGGSYDDYAPAYRYGNEMRRDAKYRDRDWSDIEQSLKSDWESRNANGGVSTWDKFKAAVKRGWDKITPDIDSNDDYDEDYRSDWNNNYASLGGSYDEYAPAYRYGGQARRDAKYRDRDWSDVESDLKTDWESRYANNGGASTWDKFKAAVRRGWDHITPDMNTDDWYHSDYTDNYSSLGGSYDDYAPAYGYGTQMRSSAKYRDRSWDEIQSDLKSDWDSRYANDGVSTWDKFKAAVKRGWDKITPDIDSDSYYRTHWNANYASSDAKYDDYTPAYLYGSEARRLQKYRSRDWDDVESDLKTDWESRHAGEPSTWQKFKDAVHHGWDKITPDMDDDSTYYHDHYEANYAASGAGYDDLAPAYRYGSDAARNDSYRGRDWNDVEPDLKSDWSNKYGNGEPSAWEKMKAAVRHGWDKMTNDTEDDVSYYRTHWNSTYGTTNETYGDYDPAYRYGNEMRSSDKYRGKTWDQVENDLHTDWDSRYSTSGVSTWDKMKAAVRHGWDRVTS